MFTKRRNRPLAAIICRLAVATLVVIIFGQTVEAQSGPNAEVLKEILHTSDKREEKLNPVWVRYHVTYWESSAWRKVMAPHDAPEESRWTDDCEFARKGNKRRTWAKGGRPSPTMQWAGERFWIYTGEVQIAKLTREDNYTIKKQPESLFAAETPFQVIGEDALPVDLAYWSAGKSVNISVSAKGDDGAVVVDWRYPAGWSTKYWLLPEKGWSIKRREAYNERNGPMNFAEVKEFGVCNGIPYPKRGKRDNYMATNELGMTIEFDVDSIETRAAHIPDSLFQVEIPKTANVYDADLKVTVRNTELTESHLKEVVARAAGRGGWMWWLWAPIGVAVFAVAALTGWVFFGRKRAAIKTAVNPQK